MRFVKKEPDNCTEILNQLFLLNEHLKVNQKYIYNRHWENNGISNILDDKCNFLFPEAMIQKYNLNTPCPYILQIQTCLPMPSLKKTT